MWTALIAAVVVVVPHDVKFDGFGRANMWHEPVSNARFRVETHGVSFAFVKADETSVERTWTDDDGARDPASRDIDDRIEMARKVSEYANLFLFQYSEAPNRDGWNFHALFCVALRELFKTCAHFLPFFLSSFLPSFRDENILVTINRMRLVSLLAFALLVVAIYVQYIERRKSADTARVKAARLRFRKAERAGAASRADVMKKEPAVLQTMRDIRESFVSRGEWPALLQLGDVYRRGSYPTHTPDPDVALRIYKVACGSPDPATAGAAQLKYIECRVDAIASEDIAGDPLPIDIANECIAVASRRIAISPSTARPHAPQVPVQPTYVPVEIDVWATHGADLVTTVPGGPLAIVSDTQNVHDHAVTRGMHKALREMASRGDASEDVTMCILESDASPAAKADALAVLDTLGTAQHSTLGTSEREALDKVWSRIRNLPDEAARNAEKILVAQLASGVERGHVVCSTGKIARIVSTLDGLVDEPAIKPMWAIREEIGSLAARVRDTHGDDDTGKSEFKRRAAELYVDELGMSADLVGNIVDAYAVGFS